ncbi:unnamed protein product, partial [Cladocopium goreaui]
SLWPHCEDVVRMTEVPLHIPGTRGTRGRSLERPASAEMARSRERSKRTHVLIQEDEIEVPYFDAEAALAAARLERTQRSESTERGRPLGVPGTPRRSRPNDIESASASVSRTLRESQTEVRESSESQKHGQAEADPQRAAAVPSPGGAATAQAQGGAEVTLSIPREPSLERDKAAAACSRSLAQAEAMMMASIRPRPRAPKLQLVAPPPVVEVAAPVAAERRVPEHRAPGDRPDSRQRGTLGRQSLSPARPKKSPRDLRAREKIGKLLVAHYEVRSKSLETKKWTRMLMRVILASEEKNPEALKEGLALLQNAQNLIGAGDEGESKSRVLLQALCLVDRKVKVRSPIADAVRTLEELTKRKEKLLVDMAPMGQEEASVPRLEDTEESLADELKKSWQIVHHEELPAHPGGEAKHADRLDRLKKKTEAEKEAAVEQADERTLWVLRRVSTIFAVRKEKQERFLQLFGDDAPSRTTLQTFLHEVEVPAVFFHLSPNGESCSASSDLPTAAQMKKKVLALVRSKHEVEIDIGLAQRPVVFIELAKGIMDLINSYCHSVYLSVLMNPANQRGWSDLISRDLIDKFHSFLATLHVTVGLMKGQTLLPLPPREATGSQDSSQSKASSSAISKDRVHVLEGAVITWTKQVRYVLKQEPEHVFREGDPQPDAELRFWQNRANNLNSIQNQLQMEGVKRVLRFLEASKSTYVSPFARLQKEVEDNREEANENVRFLKTLEPYVNSLLSESIDFEALEEVFEDIFHMLLLIWRHSKYYNSLARLAVIVRQVCNSLIAQATRYISGSSVFEMIQSEAQECYTMLETVTRALESLQDSYHTYRNLSEQGNSSAAVLTAKSDVSTGGVMGTGWRLRNNVVFGRLEAFGERVGDILDFVKTVLQFHKLERVDIGGTKGKVLSQSVAKVHEEFEKAVDKFRRVPYDIFDVKEAAFIQDFHEFRLTIRDLDRRLGSVLAAAFNDQDTLHGRAKLLDAFEGLLERPVIQAELVSRQKVLIAQYRQDVDEIHANFSSNQEKVDTCETDAPIFSNLPPVAGALSWARSLRTRLQEPMPKILAYNELMKEVPESFRARALGVSAGFPC